ncbi:MAG TPA: choice-of-anchor D domain-containing protein [Solirubrobacterales bacterium]|nr:choice-of-anchor D domain-containing protein [Solirubrobacterales bacterium]
MRNKLFPLGLPIVLLAALAFPAGALAAPEGPSLVFSPAPVAFAKTTQWTESPTVTVDVVNEGDAAAPVDKVTIEGPEAGEFKLHGSDCVQVDPGQHCSVWASFSPGSSGEKQATLEIALKEAPTQTVQLAGTAVPPQISFSPSVYDFGVQQVNRGNSSNVQLFNSGEAPIQIGSIGVGGPDTNNFGTGYSDCFAPGGRWLAPGDSCNVQVYFNPYDTVSYEAQLQAQAYGETFTAELTGSGGRAIVAPADNPVDFGAVTAGSAGPVETITLTNSGNLPGNFFIAVIAGGDSASFQMLDEDCSAAPVMPAGTCTVHVRFNPRSAGPKSARLALFGDDDGGTMVVLNGEGIAPAVTLAPPSFDFGALAVGARSAAHAFVVRNDGGAPLDLDGVTISGANLDQFTLVGDECTGATLEPDNGCLVLVRFAPDSPGAKIATLRVRSDAGVFTIALRGAGAGDAAERSSVSYSPQPPKRRGKHRRFGRGTTLSAARAHCAAAPCRKARHL